MKKTIIVTLVVLSLGGMVAASMMQGEGRERGTKVYAEEVARSNITQIVKASGQIDPRVKVNLSAHVIAKIERLYVEEGDEVEAGQPVLELEREAFVAARDRAQAQLQIARTQKRQAEIDLRDAEIKRARYQRLVDEGVVPSEQLESAELRYDSAQLSGERNGEEVRRWQAELEKARDDLAKVTLYAPLTGRVIALNAEEGEVVVSGTMNNPASVIGTIADLSEILAEVDVDETEVVHVALDQQAIVEVDALRDVEYRGKVVEIGSSGYNRPQQPDVTFFKVKILLEDPDERLRPGMSARAEIDVATQSEALVVPIQTVVYRPPLDADEEAESEDDEIRVAFVIEDGKAVQRPVEIGLSDATRVEIVSGLTEGETVITGPYRMLRDLEHDAAVRIDNEDEAETVASRKSFAAGKSKSADEPPDVTSPDADEPAEEAGENEDGPIEDGPKDGEQG